MTEPGQIIVLDHGRTAEQGTHHQLRHAGGQYQRMWGKRL
jgi:ATP-binding cassette subfamily B protein